MKIKVNDVYKVELPTERIAEENYEYWLCYAEMHDHYILHNVKQYILNNGLVMPNDLDEYFESSQILDIRRFKKYNSLEAIYSKTQEVHEEVIKKREFKIV